jgi:hypothetical protein
MVSVAPVVRRHLTMRGFQAAAERVQAANLIRLSSNLCRLCNLWLRPWPL